jgi:uncharacterized protein (DUF433 family)
MDRYTANLIVYMRFRGKSTADIAKELNISKEEVEKCLKEIAIEKPKN